MDIVINVWLYDILKAIEEIESFFPEQRRYADYQKDIRTRRAVERNLEIIGEAMNRILKEEKSIEITHSRNIVDIRNKIIHGYDSVSDDIVWGVIIKYLPVLKSEVKILLGST